MFVKKKNGFVVPVEIFIKFHHSVDYQYTFLAIMKPFYEMVPFANGVKYTMDQLLFLIVENDIEGCISEYSDSTVKLLKNFGVRLNAEHTSITQRISDLLPDLDFGNIRNTREDRYYNKEIYEAEHVFDLSCFQSSQVSNNIQVAPIMKSANNNILVSGFGGDPRMAKNLVRVKTRIFEERYSAGILDLNIFCFAFIQETQSPSNYQIISDTGNKLHKKSSQNR
jgi:hypothetical protein